MLTPGTDIVRRDSIEELCGHRARALELYTLARRTMTEAETAYRRACGGKDIVSTEFLRDMRYKDLARFVGEAQTTIDQSMWRHLIDATQLGSLMDAEERKRFEASLKDKPPEVTPDNVFATLSRLAGDANMIFRRGLANAFGQFCGDYKSHDGFKIGKRFLITCLVTGNHGFHHLNHYRDDAVRDLDRCMHVLDGKAAPDYQEGVLPAIRTAISTKQAEAQSAYFRVRLYYGNGNAHFYPLRQDLVDQANRLIAAHYGETLGAGHSARNAA